MFVIVKMWKQPEFVIIYKRYINNDIVFPYLGSKKNKTLISKDAYILSGKKENNI